MRFSSLEFDSELLKAGDPGHNYFRISEENAELIYTLTKYFWSARPEHSDDVIKDLVSTYRKSLYPEPLVLAREKILEIYAGRDQARPFSLIDFGGASGSLCYFLQDQFPDDPIRYALVDAFPGFVDDFKENFPGHNAILADAEQFRDLDDEAFGETPFDLFFASHVLYLIKPSVARGVLARASRLTDNFVILDNIENFEGALDKENPVVFDYYSEGGQVYFSHYFEEYLSDIGFETVDCKACDIRLLPQDTLVPGYCVFHARRRP